MFPSIQTQLALFALILLFAMNTQSHAQLTTGWKTHDLSRPQPEVVTPGESNLPLKAPRDAIVLFDGEDLSQWCDDKGNETKWKIVDGAMESVAGAGYIFTKESYGDCQLHVEWASPAKVEGNGQGRGNSGVFLMTKYEIQVLDSFNNATYADGGAGAIYGQYPPLVNASRAPGEWQSYDIIFRQPRFDDDGNLKSAARLTVLHNGVLIQDHSEIFGPSNWILHDNYQAGVEKAPLSLQDHGNPVRFRNIWIRPLAAERARPEQPYRSESADFELTQEARDKVAGEYDGFRIRERDGKLYMNYLGRRLELVPLSETEFQFRLVAGSVELELDDEGNVQAATVSVDAAGKRQGKKR